LAKGQVAAARRCVPEGGPSALDRADGEVPSYLEIADAIARHGARADADRRELYRRLTPAAVKERMRARIEREAVDAV
jgi:hypothetical protein